MQSDKRCDSCGSLEVLPNNSPAPSELSVHLGGEAESLSIGLPLSPSSQKSEKLQNSHKNLDSGVATIDRGANKNNENTSSGIDSEIFSTNESNESEPPQKLYITENEKGEKLVHGKRCPKQNKEFVHKVQTSPTNPSQLFWSSEATKK